METVKLQAISKNGHILIDIPTKFDNCKIEMVIVLNKLNDTNEISTNKYDFSCFNKKLEWDGDSVKEQRDLRNEWK